MNLFLRKTTALAAGAVSIMVLCVLFSIGAIAGGAGGGGVAGGGSGTEASLSYDPFAGDVDRQIEIRQLELEALQAEADAAQAELDLRMKEQYALELLWALSKEYVPKAMPTPAAQLTTSTMMRLLELAILD